MKVTAVSRTTWLGLGIVLILAGCKNNDGDGGIPPMVGDGGTGVDRFVVAPRGAADVGAAETNDAVVDSGGETGDALRQPDITIDIDPSSLVPVGTAAAANSIIIPGSFVAVP
jgi:hypothetical protein